MIESKSGVPSGAADKSARVIAMSAYEGALPGPERVRAEAASIFDTISRRIAGPSSGGSAFFDFCSGLALCSSRPCFSLNVPVGPEARPR